MVMSTGSACGARPACLGQVTDIWGVDERRVGVTADSCIGPGYWTVWGYATEIRHLLTRVMCPTPSRVTK